jgi:anti-sigma regulatory factor (Ser/Thr protein kinase)
MHATREFCERRETLPATLEAVEAFVRDVCLRCLRMHCPNIAFTAELLLRETLVNAVEHGSRGEPDGTIQCVLRLRGRTLIIAVADQGAGFDWRAARQRESDLSEPSGRGLQILWRYATRVRFNEKGNSVTIIKRL